MRKLVATVFALLFATLAISQERVADEVAAIKIAEKALIRVYGKKKIESERPFRAELKDGIWTVFGTLYCRDKDGNRTTHCLGGVATARISEADGRVLSTIHTK